MSQLRHFLLTRAHCVGASERRHNGSEGVFADYPQICLSRADDLLQSVGLRE